MTTDTARPAHVETTTGLRGTPEEAHLRVTLPRVIRSEWVKLASLRSTWITVAVAVVVLVGFGAMATGVAAGDVSHPGAGGGGGRIASIGPTDLSLAGAALAGLILGILGVLAVSSEYSSGMIRATLAAVPRRWPVLVAKTLVVGALALVVALPATLAAFFVGQAILGVGKNVALTDPGVLRAVLGTGAYVAATALLGLAIGALLRHATGAVGVMFVLLLLAPGLLGLILPSSWADSVLKYLPSNAASSFTSVTAPSGMLSPGVGVVVLAAWVVALLVGAEVLLRRRDA
jgi:ABC-type transport system involved in multi-copper enzyme maturation permease subunit